MKNNRAHLLFYRIQHGAIGPLYVTSIYSTWIFCRGVSGFATDCPCVVNHLPPTCCSTFWKSTFKQQLGCRFYIMDSISSFFCILTNVIIYVLIHHIIFRLFLNFLNIVLYIFKYSCTNIFIDVVVILSIILLFHLATLGRVMLNSTVYCVGLLCVLHYNDVIMSSMASQITSLTIVYPSVYSGVNQRKHQSSASPAFVRGIHRLNWSFSPETPNLGQNRRFFSRVTLKFDGLPW